MKKKQKPWFVMRNNKLGKMLTVMKLTFMLMVLFVCTLNAEVRSQQRFSMHKVQTTYGEVFSNIMKQTGQIVVYNNEHLNKDEKLSVNFYDSELKDALNEILKGTYLTFEILDEFVILKKALIVQEKKVIKGKVKDEKGNPLLGVSVVVKGTTVGVSTDVNGDFEISIPKDFKKMSLEFSFVGMKTQIVEVGKKKEINVSLEEDSEKIEEIVITGIFRRTKENSTGASITIDEKQLKEIGNQNILQSLKTLDPSFKLLESNEFGSDPNKLPTIELRGTNGIADLDSKYKGNPNQPLFILDGFESTLQRIIDLDPNRVSSITILKDASAAALYGSRSANGVIVIETKAPKVGKLRISYNGDFAIVVPDLLGYDLLNAKEKLQLEWDAGHFDSKTVSNSHSNLEYYNRLLRNVEEGVDTYWLSKPLKTGFENRHNLFISGGDKNIRYGINFSAKYAPGVMKKSSRDNYQGGVFLSYRKKDILFKNDMQISYNLAKNSPYGRFSAYTHLNPYFKPFNENGEPSKLFDKKLPNSFRTAMNKNPLHDALLNITDQEDYFSFINNFSIEWDVAANLKVMGRLSLSKQYGEVNYFLPAQHSQFSEIGNPTSDPEEYMRRGKFRLQNKKSFNIDGDVNVKYGRNINEHTFFLVVVLNMSNRTYEDNTIVAEGFPNGNMNDIGFAKQYFKDSKPISSYTENRLAGLLLTANYSYKNKYLLDFSLKLDGSSQFGANNRYAPIWSLGTGWNIHKEKLFENIEAITRLKIRGSYGITASQNFSPYQALRTYTYDINKQYSGVIPAYLMGLGNKDLKWQQTEISNLGFDFGFIDDRLLINFDLYKRNTSNLLAPITIAPSYGYLSYVDNIGETENKGFEGNIRYTIIKNTANRFFWNVGFSVAHNTNKIKKISNTMKNRNEEILKKAYEEGRSAPVILYQEGKSLTSIYAVKSLGINPVNGREMFLDKKGVTTYSYRLEDQVKVGDTRPDYEGIFNTSINYKNLNLGISLRYKIGGQIYNQTLVDRVENADLFANVDKRVYDDRWRNPGDHALYKDIKDLRVTRPTSRFVQDENVLKCESINMGYEIHNKNILKKVGVERIRLNGYMNDVFRFSTVKQERGLSYPFANRFAFSINVTF